MLERIPFSIRELSPLHGKTVLDIGCGSGRASILLAKEGARVTGIDCAERMIELAKKYQHRESTIDNIEFMCCDFMNEFTDDHKYDYCIVLGVLDYIQDPWSFLTKIKRITTKKIIATYPAKFTLQSFIRKVWLSKRTGHVYLHSAEDLREMYRNLGMKNIKIIAEPEKAFLHSGFIIVSEV